jgi:hypothetical protein
MNPLIWFITLGRTAGLALSLAGQAKLGQLIDNLASIAESGQDVEAHLAAVRAKLEELHAAGATIGDADWDAVVAGIESGSGRLQGS